MKYAVNCQEGCGRQLAWLDLPEGTPLSGQDKGFLCEDCATKLAANRPPEVPSPMAKEKAARLEALKAKLGPTGALSGTDLDELMGILSPG